VGAPAVLVRLTSLSPNPAVVHGAIVASIAMLYVPKSLWLRASLSVVIVLTVASTVHRWTGYPQLHFCALRHVGMGAMKLSKVCFLTSSAA
jgi:hypothetical protein